MDKNALQNPKVSIKAKLALYWASLMFLYIYADYFGLMVPGHLERMIAVETPVGPTTPGLLVVFSVLLIIPALMILGSAALKAPINKWLNIVVGFLYAIISILMIVDDINNEWMVYFVLYQFVELGVFALIVVTAWRWPREVQ